MFFNKFLIMEIIFELVEVVGSKTSAVIVIFKKDNGDIFKKSEAFSFKEDAVDFLEKMHSLRYVSHRYFDLKLKEVLSLNIDSKKHFLYFRFFFKDRPPFLKKRQAFYKISLSLDEEKKRACFLLDGLQATPFFSSKEEGEYYLLIFLKAEVITKEKQDEAFVDLKNSSILLDYASSTSNN